jgi:hypothetical protein
MSQETGRPISDLQHFCDSRRMSVSAVDKGFIGIRSTCNNAQCSQWFEQIKQSPHNRGKSDFVFFAVEMSFLLTYRNDITNEQPGNLSPSAKMPGRDITYAFLGVETIASFMTLSAGRTFMRLHDCQVEG